MFALTVWTTAMPVFQIAGRSTLIQNDHAVALAVGDVQHSSILPARDIRQ